MTVPGLLRVGPVASGPCEQPAGRAVSAPATQPLLRAFWGGALLIAPRSALGLLGAGSVPRAGLVVARLLGGRHLLQAVLTWTQPVHPVLVAGGVTDVLHAASDVLLAVLRPQWRRAALSDAALASAFAVSSWSRAHRQV